MLEVWRNGSRRSFILSGVWPARRRRTSSDAACAVTRCSRGVCRKCRCATPCVLCGVLAALRGLPDRRRHHLDRLYSRSSLCSAPCSASRWPPWRAIRTRWPPAAQWWAYFYSSRQLRSSASGSTTRLWKAPAWQGTVGKKILGLRVTDLNGNRVSFGRASGRFFGKIVSGFTLMIGYIMAGFTEKKQALHDMIAGCLVVKSV